MELLAGKNAIVTGANRGIGNAIVHEFASLKCNIWACARKQTEEFETEMSMLAQEEGVSIWPVYFELTDQEEMKAAVKQIHSSKNIVDILVNAAGILHSNMFQMSKIEELRKVFDVNFFAPVEFTQLILRLMIRNKKGSIIYLSSISGIDPHASNSFYGSSKAAVTMFSKVLAAEVAPFGIRVNAVAPGNTKTDMIKPVIEKMGSESMFDITAMGRFAEPFEIAKVIAFLASDESTFVNGQVIRVDGGSK